MQAAARSSLGLGARIIQWELGRVAVLGSRFVALLDGVEGPKIEALLNNVMENPVQVSSYWTGKVPETRQPRMIAYFGSYQFHGVHWAR